VEVIRYLEQMAKRIPVIIDKEGKPIDHVKNLRSVYKQERKTHSSRRVDGM